MIGIIIIGVLVMVLSGAIFWQYIKDVMDGSNDW